MQRGKAIFLSRKEEDSENNPKNTKKLVKRLSKTKGIIILAIYSFLTYFPTFIITSCKYLRLVVKCMLRKFRLRKNAYGNVSLSTMKRLGIFGGSFEPFHTEHLKVARQAVKELKLDKLLIMPCSIAPHKNGHKPVSDDVRKEIILRSIQGEDKTELSSYELEVGGVSYTYKTVEHFKPFADELYFIVGADMLVDFKTWKYPEKITENCEIAVFGRKGTAIDTTAEREYFMSRFGKDFITLSYTGKDISATKIRVYSALGLDISPFVTEEAKEYIDEKMPFYTEYKKYIDFVLHNEKEKRIIHTAGVIICAVELARRYKINEDKAFLTALLHDCAKYLDKKDFKGYVSPKGSVEAVEHAFLGAFVAENVLEIKDEEIINAIKYHSTGRRNVSVLEKIILVSDMTEEGRNYEGVEELREAHERDLDECFAKCISQKRKHVLENAREGDFCDLTEECYKQYVLKE